jgi:2-keto-4-pentenoate hydratase/2-oxohepta-3-ene-1,7-dioic acid hydratase in catechol pathway
MFYLNAAGWRYYCPKSRSWQDCGTSDFSRVFQYVEAGNPADNNRPADALPAFSGSKILCVGRNYRKHAAELGNDVPDRPLWFSKPPSAIIGHNETVLLPRGIGRIDYEGELALIIGRRTRRITPAEAENHIGGITVCLDMTARDLQKSDGQWTRAKGFDTFLPLGWKGVKYDSSWKDGSIEVRKNGITVQNDKFSSMVFDFSQLVADLSLCMTLEPGDIILSGTPRGLARLQGETGLKSV